MAGPVIKKRPVVLRLAELQKYPTLEDRYAATLPFKGGAADCDCWWYPSESINCCDITPPGVRGKCIRRTGERWAWFSAARKLDDTYGERLGTLIYLPWEIRQIIIKWLGYPGVIDIGDVVSGIPSPMNEYNDHPGYYKNLHPHHGLWLASPSTKSEMEHYYFSHSIPRFCSPKELELFADRLPTYQWSLLRSVTLQMPGSWNWESSLKEWMSACARLPPNLISIILAFSWDLVGAEIHGHWFLVSSSRDVAVGPELHHANVFINTVGKLAHRVAAKAKIELEVSEWCEPRHIYHRVLDDFDPWSKDYLRWWEEKTKIDFESDGTFNRAA